MFGPRLSDKFNWRSNHPEKYPGNNATRAYSYHHRAAVSPRTSVCFRSGIDSLLLPLMGTFPRPSACCPYSFPSQSALSSGVWTAPSFHLFVRISNLDDLTYGSTVAVSGDRVGFIPKMLLIRLIFSFSALRHEGKLLLRFQCRLTGHLVDCVCNVA